MTNKFKQLEVTMAQLSDTLLLSYTSHPSFNREGSSWYHGAITTCHSSLRLRSLNFPRFIDIDPTQWLNIVNQYFEFQKIIEDEKVLLTSFHLEGEANQWWQHSLKSRY